ncbi:MAG: outer membrane beta-barrel protein [Deltaproteobacteria bacterium]|nr:outer membrane beta-barrel protein [Deltaproteobacteria bacterium]
MRVRTSRLLTVVLLAALPATAWADEEAPKVIEFSGFVDTSVFFPLTGFGTHAVSLGLDQVELDITARPAAGLTLRTDLNWMPAVNILDGLDFSGEVSLLTFDSIVEQGYAKYIFGGGDRGFFFQAGKRNAPVGTEALDAPDMYQYSHSLLFDNAAPSNLTGFFLGFDNGGSGLGGQVWVTNGWDEPSTPAHAAVGGRLEYAFATGGVGLSTTIGPLAEDKIFAMFDIDANIAAGIFTGLLNVNVATFDGEVGAGVSAVGNVAIGDTMSATARVSYLMRDKLAGAPGTAYKGLEVTGAYLFTITDHFGALVEIRGDIPDAGDTTVGAAIEATATF